MAEVTLLPPMEHVFNFVMLRTLQRTQVPRSKQTREKD